MEQRGRGAGGREPESLLSLLAPGAGLHRDPCRSPGGRGAGCVRHCVPREPGRLAARQVDRFSALLHVPCRGASEDTALQGTEAAGEQVTTCVVLGSLGRGVLRAAQERLCSAQGSRDTVRTAHELARGPAWAPGSLPELLGRSTSLGVPGRSGAVGRGGQLTPCSPAPQRHPLQVSEQPEGSGRLPRSRTRCTAPPRPLASPRGGPPCLSTCFWPRAGPEAGKAK